jgi:alpha-glucosidase
MSRPKTTHQEPGRLADGVTRYVPRGVRPESLPRSFALAAPLDPQDPASAVSAMPFEPRFTQTKAGWEAHVPLVANSSLYGTGEVAGPLLRNGFVTEVWTKQPFRLEPDGTAASNYDERSPSLYQAHPWVLAVSPDGSGLGVLADTTFRLELDLRDGVVVRCAEPFPVILIEGRDPEEVVCRLSHLTGRIDLPPRWTLGHHQCRFSYHPDSRVREIADGFRERRIPCDTIWVDIHYMDAYKVFTFDREEFPDPTATNDYLHEQDFKSVWILDPAIKAEPGYRVYDEGVEHGHFLTDAEGMEYQAWTWPGDAAFPDFTRPETRRWWSDHTIELLGHGMDGLWVDLNEPSPILPLGAELPDDLVHRGGGDIPAGPHAQYHNVYGMLMSAATRDAMLEARPEKRPFVLTRSSYLGGQRYAATWTGDNSANWEHYRWSISMILNLGLSGQPYSGPDIGGFAGTPSPELFAHWMGLGALLPFCRVHHGLEGDQEPWSFGPEVESIAREALERRYRLLHYLYTCFWEASTTGLPVARPLFLDAPNEPSLRAEDAAFLIGKDLLVQPSLGPNQPHTAATPGGVWRAFTLVGEDPTNDRAHPILSLRAGAALPLAPVGQTTDQVFAGPLTLLASLDEDGKARGRVYQDAGDGFAYRDGEYRLTTYEVRADGDDAEVRIVSVEGSMPPAGILPSVRLL